MSENNWKKIWSKKRVGYIVGNSEFEIFKQLKKADGYDVAVVNEESYYRQFYNRWISIYEKMMQITSNSIDSVYEVGCGSGVNLFLFRNRHNVKVGAIDYSESLLEDAGKIIDSQDLFCGDALSMDDTIKYDVVISDGVFQYFDSLDYAEKVLKKMINKSNKVVFIGELHDVSYEKELMEYRRKTIPNYDDRYKGLRKQFYDKKWIERIADGYNILYTSNSSNDEYINGRYSFNCFIIK